MYCSPFQFQVLPSDPSRKLSVSVPGLESGVCAQIPQTFTIDSRNGEVPESVAVRTPSGKDVMFQYNTLIKQECVLSKKFK